MIKPDRGEYLQSRNAIREIFYYNDTKEGFDVISRTVFKKKPIEIHHPFDRRGGRKYKHIDTIEFHDIRPGSVTGVYKAVSYGLGFTKYLSPIIYQLEAFPKVTRLIVSPTAKSTINKNHIVFNAADLSELYSRIKPLRDEQSEELRHAAHNALAAVFPETIKSKEAKYTKGNLGLYIKNKKINPEQLSKEDVGELLKILPEYIPEESLLYRAEEKINFIKLAKIKKDFSNLIKQKTDTVAFEEKCQKFFSQNNWIFSNILSVPVALYQEKVYVGGKTIENSQGRIADFLYRNHLTRNVYIIEIKTPLKKLIDSSTPYRKPHAFSLGKELTGGLSQLQDQKDQLQKHFYSLAGGSQEFHAFNPKALLVIGRLSDLKVTQIPAFELFRNNLKDIEVITYDELLERTNLVLGQFVEAEPRKATAKKVAIKKAAGKKMVKKAIKKKVSKKGR